MNDFFFFNIVNVSLRRRCGLCFPRRARATRGAKRERRRVGSDFRGASEFLPREVRREESGNGPKDPSRGFATVSQPANFPCDKCNFYMNEKRLGTYFLRSDCVLGASFLGFWDTFFFHKFLALLNSPMSLRGAVRDRCYDK